MSREDRPRLFVGQLPPQVTEQDLNDYFVKFGEITDVFLPHASNKPRRIAFVTFAEKTSLYQALAEKEAQILGETATLTQAVPKGAPPPAGSRREESNNSRVFLNGLPNGTTNDALKAFFSAFGQVKDVFYKQPNSYGFVTFETEAEMFAALAQKPLVFNNDEITAEVAKPKGPRGGDRGPPVHSQSHYSPYGGGGGYQAPYGAPSPYGGYQAPPQRESRAHSSSRSSEPNTRLFIGALGPDTTDDSLRAYFAQFGEVIDIFRPGGATGSFGFCTYGTPQDMFKALATAEHVLDGTTIRVTEAEPKPGQGGPRGGGGGGGGHSSAPREHRIFVGSIMEDVNDDDVRAHFSSFGAIKDVYRPGRQKAGSDGSMFGFVIFEQSVSMSKALAETTHIVKGHTLMVKRARERPQNPSADGAPQHGQHDPHAVHAAAMAAHAHAAAQYDYGAYAAAYGQQQQPAPGGAPGGYNPYLSAPGYAAQAEPNYNAGGYGGASRPSGKSSRYSPY